MSRRSSSLESTFIVLLAAAFGGCLLVLDDPTYVTRARDDVVQSDTAMESDMGLSDASDTSAPPDDAPIDAIVGTDAIVETDAIAGEPSDARDAALLEDADALPDRDVFVADGLVLDVTALDVLALDVTLVRDATPLDTPSPDDVNDAPTARDTRSVDVPSVPDADAPSAVDGPPSDAPSDVTTSDVAPDSVTMMDATTSCSPGLTSCPTGSGSACVDLQSSNGNCGACGAACTVGTTCRLPPAGPPALCVACGGHTQPCCQSTCGAGLSCVGAVCSCGGFGEPCCSGLSCPSGATCLLSVTMGSYCVSLLGGVQGSVGQPCGTGGACSPGLHCVGPLGLGLLNYCVY